MKKTTNYNLNLPEKADQFQLETWNDNTDIIDKKLKTLESNFSNYARLSSFDGNIAENDDLDAYINAGCYRCGSSAVCKTLKNAPINIGCFKLVVDKLSNSGYSLKQYFLSEHTSNYIYARTYNNSKWYAWERIVTDTLLDTKMSNEIATVNKTIDSKVSTINNTITTNKNTVEKYKTELEAEIVKVDDKFADYDKITMYSVSLLKGDDLNNFKDAGFYYGRYTSVTEDLPLYLNTPLDKNGQYINSSFDMIVKNYGVQENDKEYSPKYLSQTIYYRTLNTVYRRIHNKYNETWSDWLKIATTDDIESRLQEIETIDSLGDYTDTPDGWWKNCVPMGIHQYSTNDNVFDNQPVKLLHITVNRLKGSSYFIIEAVNRRTGAKYIRIGLSSDSVWLKDWTRIIDETALDSILSSQFASYVPTGVIQAYMGKYAPEGWLSCNGQSVSVQKYNKLYTMLNKINSDLYHEDGDGNFKLPKLTGRFLEGYSGTNLGTTVDAGLPNITTSMVRLDDQAFDEVSGALVKVEDSTYDAKSSMGNTGAVSVKFDASNANKIYGNSSTVQPNAFYINYIIKT